MKNTKSIIINAVGVKDAFAGIGHCTLYLIDEFAKLHPELNFHVYVSSTMKSKYTYTAINVQVISIKLPFNSLLARIIWDQTIIPFVSFRYTILISMMNASSVFSFTKQFTFIYDLADINMPQRFSTLKIFYLKLFRFATMRKSLKVITISQASKHDLISNYPNFIHLFDVIPLGFKNKFTNFISPKSDFNYFLFVSTIEPGKNVPRLIKAFKKFLVKHPDWRLIIAGSKGWGFTEVEKIIATENLASSIECLGYISEEKLNSLFTNCKGFVFPSLYEGFGLPVLEAMQYYVPILTSNVSSLPEVGGDGVIYCDPKNVDDIANGLEILLSTPKASFVEHYNLQLSKFTWSHSANKFNEIISPFL